MNEHLREAIASAFEEKFVEMGEAAKGISWFSSTAKDHPGNRGDCPLDGSEYVKSCAIRPTIDVSECPYTETCRGMRADAEGKNLSDSHSG